MGSQTLVLALLKNLHNPGENQLEPDIDQGLYVADILTSQSQPIASHE
ncbi:MAG TPA: hypothetical protein PKY67_11235 [Nitrosomonas sp.]|nr:hypothetical protein [Nitrosomonas sp.]HRB98267.1 hypothetical protein [Nitrosomonas sp.]